MSRTALEEASTENRVERGFGPQDSPCGEALLIPQRAVSKKPCRGVCNRDKGILLVTSCSMQVAPGDRVRGPARISV